MTFTRAVLLLLGGLMFADYKYGDARLAQSAADQTVQLGHQLADRLSGVARWLAPVR